MKIGFIISMYDEIDIVKNTVNILKQNDCPIIVIQSDPQQLQKLLEPNQVDFYQKLSDLAGSKDEYLEERNDKNSKAATTPVKAITRNFKFGFNSSKSFDIDWWVVILGDVSISNIKGIKQIIQEMIQKKKLIGITRAVGQIFKDNSNRLTRIQKDNTTDFMPQFLIVNSYLISKGLFSTIPITNPYTSEQCLGDEVSRYCLENNINFKKLVHIISNYAYPQFISGLKYNSDRINMPQYVDGFVNMIRRIKISLSK
tara:strand:+ start:4106 stop:4873 length:768 start_codon:yes stop_codon:yes gene_type:complete